VIALGSTAWTNKTTGKRVESLKSDVWKFRDGKAVSFLEFYDSFALIEAGR
jgi:ketosteroid isomerase-like protein